MRINVYRVTYFTAFEKEGKEVRRSSPSSILSAARDPNVAFSIVPVPTGGDGETPKNVCVTTQQIHGNVLSEIFRRGSEVTELI